MATYVVLVNFTDQGIRSVSDSPKRYEAFKALADKLDVQVKSTYWTVGAYDIVTVNESGLYLGVKQGVFEELRMENIPNFANIVAEKASASSQRPSRASVATISGPKNVPRLPTPFIHPAMVPE